MWACGVDVCRTCACHDTTLDCSSRQLSHIPCAFTNTSFGNYSRIWLVICSRFAAVLNNFQTLCGTCDMFPIYHVMCSNLQNNSITSLPAGIFAQFSALTSLFGCEIDINKCTHCRDLSANSITLLTADSVNLASLLSLFVVDERLLLGYSR